VNEWTERQTATFQLYTVSQKKQESLANAKVSARQPCWPKTDFNMK